MDIIGGMNAANQALNMINELRKLDKEMDKADLKLRLVDLADKLLESKQALQDAQQREFDFKAKITQLEAELAERGDFEDEDGLLHELDNDRKRLPGPFCNHCYVKEGKLFRLIFGSDMRGAYRCSNCDGYYGPVEKVNRAELKTHWDVSDPYRYE